MWCLRSARLNPEVPEQWPPLHPLAAVGLECGRWVGVRFSEPTPPPLPPAPCPLPPAPCRISRILVRLPHRLGCKVAWLRSCGCACVGLSVWCPQPPQGLQCHGPPLPSSSIGGGAAALHAQGAGAEDDGPTSTAHHDPAAPAQRMVSEDAQHSGHPWGQQARPWCGCRPDAPNVATCRVSRPRPPPPPTPSQGHGR
jgi:hypothetical protein